jgi:hypothetical protein
MGGSPGLSARWPTFYDGRNSNAGLRALTLGLLALEAQPCPDRAVLTKAWPDKVNNQTEIQLFSRARKTKQWWRFIYNKNFFGGRSKAPPFLMCINPDDFDSGNPKPHHHSLSVAARVWKWSGSHSAPFWARINCKWKYASAQIICKWACIYWHRLAIHFRWLTLNANIGRARFRLI